MAESGEKIVGAVWVRIMDDYGHVNDATPSLTGSSVALSRDGSVKDFYEVLVEEKDEARARAILSMEN